MSTIVRSFILQSTSQKQKYGWERNTNIHLLADCATYDKEIQRTVLQVPR